jgi:hypothetical protein
MKILKTRTDLLRLLPKNLIMAEIGVFKGEFSEEILDICRPYILYLVDVFTGHTASGDKDGKSIIEVDMGEEYARLRTLYQQDHRNVWFRKMLSLTFLGSLQPDYLDMVYLDADHSYESVSQELALCRKKVRAGGYICGHDYAPQWGVKRAVDEFCEREGLDIGYLTEDGCPSYCIINKK